MVGIDKLGQDSEDDALATALAPGSYPDLTTVPVSTSVQWKTQYHLLSQHIGNTQSAVGVNGQRLVAVWTLWRIFQFDRKQRGSRTKHCLQISGD